MGFDSPRLHKVRAPLLDTIELSDLCVTAADSS